jgi:hypothetical protein
MLAKRDQTEEHLRLINKAVSSGDVAEIKRAIEIDAATLRSRAPIPPPSPQRPVQAAGAGAGPSPAKSPAKFRNAPPDLKTATLDYIKRNGAWFVTSKRQADPTRPCRACGGIDHWTNDATKVNAPNAPSEHEWVCLKVRMWALPPVRPEYIDVE